MESGQLHGSEGGATTPAEEPQPQEDRQAEGADLQDAPEPAAEESASAEHKAEFDKLTEELDKKFDYAKFDDVAAHRQDFVVNQVKELYGFVELNVCSSREKFVAFKRLEEFEMWFGKAVKVDQQWRNRQDQAESPAQ